MRSPFFALRPTLPAILLFALVLLLGQGALPNPATAADLDVSFEFSPENKGPKGPSPEIVVKGIPPGAASLKVALKDLDSPKYKHGGGKLKLDSGATEAVVPAGSLKDRYKGPHPPRNVVHRYVFPVSTIGADGKVLSEGQAERSFKGF